MDENIIKEFVSPVLVTAMAATHELMPETLPVVNFVSNRDSDNLKNFNYQVPFQTEQNQTSSSLEPKRNKINNSPKAVQGSMVGTNNRYVAVVKSILNDADEDTKKYIEQQGVIQGVNWLQNNVPVYFPCADYELTVLPAEENSERMLALIVFAELAPDDFIDQMLALCAAIAENGHNTLSETISVFQRSIRPDGCKAISDYSEILIAA